MIDFIPTDWDKRARYTRFPKPALPNHYRQDDDRDDLLKRLSTTCAKAVHSLFKTCRKALAVNRRCGWHAVW
jgi:hypothetical protein